ncbi:MAG: hypothetical protein ACREDR_28210, partial [Blastocatellia bacterium]
PTRELRHHWLSHAPTPVSNLKVDDGGAIKPRPFSAVFEDKGFFTNPLSSFLFIRSCLGDPTVAVPI